MLIRGKQISFSIQDLAEGELKKLLSYINDGMNGYILRGSYVPTQFDIQSDALVVAFNKEVEVDPNKNYYIYDAEDRSLKATLPLSSATIQPSGLIIAVGGLMNLRPGRTYSVILDDEAIRDEEGNEHILAMGDEEFTTIGTRFTYSLSGSDGSAVELGSALTLTANMPIFAGAGMALITHNDTNTVIGVRPDDPRVGFSGTELSFDGSLFGEAGNYTIEVQEDFLQIESGGERISPWYGMARGEWKVELTGTVQPPEPAFAFGPETGRRLVDFRDNTSGEVQSRLWVFGDGESSTEQYPVHIYPENLSSEDVVYNGSLTIVDGENNSQVINFSHTVPAAQPNPGRFAPSIFTAFRVLSDGTKRFYFDASAVTWQTGRSIYSNVFPTQETEAAGFVDLAPDLSGEISYGARIFVNGDGPRVNLSTSIRNTNLWERAIVPTPDFSYNGLSVDVVSRAFPGALGIESEEFMLLNANNEVVASLNGSTGRLTAPAAGYYRLRHVVRTRVSPLTGFADVEDSVTPIAVAESYSLGNREFSPLPGYNYNAIDPYQRDFVGDHLATEFWGNSRTPQSLVVECFNDGAYASTSPEVAGGVKINNRAGLGASPESEDAKAATLFNSPSCVSIAAYIGDPYYNQAVKGGAIHPDYVAGAKRAQNSMNRRGDNRLEADVTANDAFTISAFWFALGDKWHLANDGTRRVPQFGNPNTLEGYQNNPVFHNQKVAMIAQGSQTKRTVAGNEGGPTHELLVAAHQFILSNNDMGEDPRTQISRDYSSGDSRPNGLRHLMMLPFGTVSDGDSYLTVRYQRYGAGNYRGEDRFWFIPVNRLGNINQFLAPIYSFSNAAHGEDNQTDAKVKIETIGHYDSRNGHKGRIKNSIASHIMGLNETKMYIHPFPFYYFENDTNVEPTNSEILQSVLKHYGLIA